MFGEELAKLFVSLGADIRDFEKKMGRAVGVINRTGKGFMDMGKILTRAITLPILAVSGIALKMSIDFESAFAGVRKTVNATEAEFAELRKGILDMSAILPASANEIAGVTEIAGQLGIKNEALLEFTRTMIDLGETTNLAANEAATALARMANIMQTDQKKIRNMGSTIVELGNNLATTEAEIVEMSLRLAGAAKQIGITEAQVLSLAAALSSLGLRADAGGTSVSKVFIEIGKAVATGSDKLADFARVAEMSIDNFVDLFEKDAAIAILKFIEGLGKVEEKGQNLFVVLDKIGIVERRMVDALLRVSNSGDLLARSLKLGTEAWKENNALTDEAAKRYETTASQLVITKNEAVKAAVAIGDTMKKALLSLISPLKAVFGWTEKLAVGFLLLPTPVRMIIGVFAGLVTAFGPVIYFLGKLQHALPLLTLSFEGLTKAVGKLRVALTLLSAHPVILMITAFVTLLIIFGIQVAKAREEVVTFAEKMEAVRKKTEDAATSLSMWTKNALLARKAVLELNIAQAEAALRLERITNAFTHGLPVTAAQKAKFDELKLSLYEMGLQLIATEKALKNLAGAEEDAGDNLDEIITPAEKIIEIYKELTKATTELAARKAVMGKEFNAAKEQAGILEEAMIRLRVEGVDPLSEGYIILAERLGFARNQARLFGMEKLDPRSQPTVDEGPPQKLEDPPWLVKLKEDEAAAKRFTDSITTILSTGTWDAAAALAEGIGQMAAGTASIGDVFATVLSVLGDVAIRIGKVAIATGIGMIAIKQAFSNPATAIAAGAALIALGSWVKSSIAGAMSGGGGFAGSGAGGDSFSGGFGGEIGNFAPRFPQDDRSFGRFPESNFDGMRIRDSSSAGEQRRELSIVIEPRAIASGDIEYSVRESARRADNRGTEVI